jgi:hypothetical protein
LIQRFAFVVLAAAGLWYGWQRLFPDDAAQIEAVLQRVAEGVGGESGGGVSAIARAAALQSEFAPDVTVDAGPPFQRIRGRDAIISAAARVNGTVRNLDVRFPDVDITVQPDRQRATALVTAEARYDEAGGGSGFDAREFEVVFTRLDGEWVIAAVTLVEPLNRLQ